MNDILNAGLQDVAGINGTEPIVDSGEFQDRLGDGVYTVTLPSGRTVIVDGSGNIIG